MNIHIGSVSLKMASVTGLLKRFAFRACIAALELDGVAPGEI